VVRVNYEDNPWFPEVLRTEMEWDRRRDPEKYAHVWRGEYERNSEARVFKNWAEEEFETPDDAVFLLGGDWGYSIDPSVLVRAFVDPRNPRRLYVDREAYRIGCEIDWTAGLFDGLECGCPPLADANGKPPEMCRDPAAHAMARKWVITADSARPETISYLQKHGYPKIVAAAKGADSVKEGVIFLQGYDIVVHPRCKHTIDELTMYSFKVDKQTQLVTPYLEDKKNHVIDSLRYAVERLRRAKPKRSINW
jgi:phage terminase large subunit